MRPLLNILASLAISACAPVLLWRYVVVPYDCNIRLKRAGDAMQATLSSARDKMRAAELARATIHILQPCVQAYPDNIGAQMVLAASYRELGRHREAASAYETALRYDRRPELYLNLGQTQIAIGDSNAALQNLVLACVYNPAYLDDIGEYHTEVKRAVDEYQLRLMNAKH